MEEGRDNTCQIIMSREEVDGYVVNLEIPDRAELPCLDQFSFVDQLKMPRPCFYMLRVLGVWQPKNCLWPFHFYSALTYLILLGSMLSILGFEYVLHGKSEKWRVGSIANSCFTLMNLTLPFAFIKYYFRFGSYDALISSVMQSSFEHRVKIRFLSRMYSAFSLGMWILAAVFFYIHWLPFFNRTWHHIVYGFTVIYTTGWWSSWLSIYGFVCHIHALQAQIFVERMQEVFQNSNRSRADERRRVGLLLGVYNELSRWIERTQREFGKIISFAMAYHTIDAIVFSIAYWDRDFGTNYSILQYVGGIAFDLASIAIKLYPAAVVSAAVHYITRRSGNECYPHHTLIDMPLERFQLYEHLSIRENMIGLRILGVKVTVRIAVGIFVTTVTGLATFLRFVIANVGTKHSLW
eukprot:gene16399-7804_t